VEIHHENAVQLKNSGEKDDMGRSVIPEVPWANDDSNILESFKD
jgi:hypothetical protein